MNGSIKLATGLTLDVEVDVIVRETVLFVSDVTHVVAGVGAVGVADVERAVVLEVHRAGYSAAVLRPADGSFAGARAAQCHRRAGTHPHFLLVILRRDFVLLYGSLL